MVGSYADHIFDEERMELAQTLEDKFYTDAAGEKQTSEKFSLLLEQLSAIAENDPFLLQKARETLLAPIAR